MNQRLSIVEVRSDKNQFLGTGFFTSTTEVLTCSHVIKGSVLIYTA